MHFNEMTEAEWKEYWNEYWRRTRELAVGRWEAIFRALAPALGPALEVEGRRHVACPVHGGKDGFRLFRDYHTAGRAICNTCGHFHDGFAVLKWVNGWTGKETVESVMATLTGDKNHDYAAPRTPLPPKVEPVAKRSNEDLKKSLNWTMQKTVSPNSKEAEPLRLYLARRGLTPPQMKALSFHPRLAYSDGTEITGYHPAMLAVVQAVDGSPVTIHRTYLDSSGRKANVPEVKKMMSYPDDLKILGGAIRLAPAARVLGVAEGIETSYAAMEGMGIPTWATVNATMMAHFVPPEEVDMVIVFSDKDRPSKEHPRGHGQEASIRLVERMWAMGKKAMAITPKGEIPEGEKSLDWLDILNRDGVAGFPSYEAVQRAMLETNLLARRAA